MPVIATLVVALAVSTTCAHYCAAGTQHRTNAASHCPDHDPAERTATECCKTRLTGLAALDDALVTPLLAVAPAPPARAPVTPPASAWAVAVPATRHPPPHRTLLAQHTSLQR